MPRGFATCVVLHGCLALPHACVIPLPPSISPGPLPMPLLIIVQSPSPSPLFIQRSLNTLKTPLVTLQQLSQLPSSCCLPTSFNTNLQQPTSTAHYCSHTAVRCPWTAVRAPQSAIHHQFSSNRCWKITGGSPTAVGRGRDRLCHSGPLLVWGFKLAAACQQPSCIIADPSPSNSGGTRIT